MNINSLTKKKVGIIGSTGYAGIEIVRLLLKNKFVDISCLSSVSFQGQQIDDVYPCMRALCDLPLVDENELIDKCDVVFCALPHGYSEQIAQKCSEKDKLVIDLGADFRLKDQNEYIKWYEKSFEIECLHKNAIYCIPELSEFLLPKNKKLSDYQIISNPGCYPTSIALGVAPVFCKNSPIKINTQSVVIDAKSGVSGAGRLPNATTHFPSCNESFSAYKVAKHRHTPEIEQTLSLLAQKDVFVTFVPHLLPVNRGILSTIYLDIASQDDKTEAADIINIYKEFYKGQQFIRVLPENACANIKNVAYTNFCDISIHLDKRTNKIIITSAIDNMIKGAAGQAIQNMNIALGLPQNNALDLVPFAF